MKRILREFMIVFYPILAILIYTFGEYLLSASLDRYGIMYFFKVVLMALIFFTVFIYFMYVFFVKDESFSKTGVVIGIVEIGIFFFPWLIKQVSFQVFYVFYGNLKNIYILLGLLAIYILLILKFNYKKKIRQEESIKDDYDDYIEDKFNKEDTSEIPLIREREFKDLK